MEPHKNKLYKIANLDTEYNRAFAANPMIKIIKDGKLVNFNDSGRFDYTEATFESEYILKGILRKPVTESEIGKSTKLTIDFDNIFGKKGNWKIDINNLPTTIEVSKYRKITIKDFNITENEITYTYKKYGPIPSDISIDFYDKEGNLLLIGSMIEDFVNRKDSTHTMRHNLNQNKYKSMAKEIKYISLRKDNSLKFLEDQSITFNLSK